MQERLLVAAVLAALSIGSADAAQYRHQPARQIAPFTPTHAAMPSGMLDTLYDQFPNATTNGAVADDSASSSDSYDAEAADDFVVPEGGWSVEQVNFMGFASDGSAVNNWTETSNITIYADDNGTPGEVVCSYPGAATDYDADNAIAGVVLPTPCALDAGTYWIGFQAVNDYFATSQQHYVTTATPQTSEMAVWRNPGDAFGSGCTAFTPFSDCGFTEPDIAFQILGTQGESGDDTIFTDGFDGS